MSNPDSKSFPWKGSYRSIPRAITAALSEIKTDLVKVAATKKISIQTIAYGQYAHVGLTHDGMAVKVIKLSCQMPQ